MIDKVIEFPKHKVVRDVPEEQIKAACQKRDQKFADSIVDDLAGQIATELDNFSVDVTSTSFAKDFALVVDSLRASVYRQLGIDHHLHPFIDENVTLLDMDSKFSKEELTEKIANIIEELSQAKETLDKETNE